MKNSLRRDARAILKAALAAANPAAMVEAALRSRRDLDRYENIFVVGAGKASGTMARAAESVLGRRITAGCVAVKDGDAAKSRRIELRASGHPVPDERGVAAAQRIEELCSSAGPRDLVVCLLSGGASALLPAPAPPVTLAEKQETTKLLLSSGATIHQINAVRKHISEIKGGRLAKLAAPARVVTLALSDVVGDQLDVIGSGLDRARCFHFRRCAGCSRSLQPARASAEKRCAAKNLRKRHQTEENAEAGRSDI